MTAARQAVDHDVLFAVDDAELDSLAAPRLAAALAAGSVAIVIATENHRRSFAGRIRSEGIDVEAAVAAGTLVLLDAAEVIGRLTPDGSFDEHAFDIVVGERVRAAVRERPVMAFGEMVALLWDDGRPQEAIELEVAWDELVRETSASLLCAYPSRLVDDAEHSSELARICGLHSTVVTAGPFERTWEFADGSGAASAARRVVGNAMRARGVAEGIFYDTLTAVTELVANAVQYGAPPLTLSLRLEPQRALVRVQDRSSVPPIVRESASRFPMRGLQLVAAVAARWGVDEIDDGKIVWAELG